MYTLVTRVVLVDYFFLSFFLIIVLYIVFLFLEVDDNFRERLNHTSDIIYMRSIFDHPFLRINSNLDEKFDLITHEV